MNRLAIDRLAGITTVKESTMTTSMPMTAVPTSAIPVKPTAAPMKKKAKLSDLLLKRNLHQENTDKPVIPANAQPDEMSGGVPGAKKEEPIQNAGPLEAPIPTSVALVAPDTTPNAETPLDPGQVPQPASAEVPTVSSPVPLDNGNDALRTLIGQHQENFKPALITDPAAAAAEVARMLNGEKTVEATSATAAASAAQVMSEATAPKPQKPHYNPESLNRSIAVTRQILGM